MPDTSELIYDRIIQSLDRLCRKEPLSSISPSDFKDPKTMETMLRMLFFLEKRSTKYFSMACAMICACFDEMVSGAKKKRILH